VVNKKGTVIRVYLPPDANCLLYVTDKVLRSRNRIKRDRGGEAALPAVAGHGRRHPFTAHGNRDLEVGQQRRGSEPDVVMACAGDVPTLETLAAVDLLRRLLPDIRVRVVNVVDLMTLQNREEHPHGLTDGSSTPCSPRTSRSSSPTTATRG